MELVCASNQKYRKSCKTSIQNKTSPAVYKVDEKKTTKKGVTAFRIESSIRRGERNGLGGRKGGFVLGFS